MINKFRVVVSHMGTCLHYNDVIMSLIAFQITSLTIVYSTVYSGADQRKHQSSASLAFVRGIHRGRVNSPHKWPVTRKMFPFDDVIMGGLFRTTAPGISFEVPEDNPEILPLFLTEIKIFAPTSLSTSCHLYDDKYTSDNVVAWQFFIPPVVLSPIMVYRSIRLLVSCLSIRPFGFFPNPFQQAISNLVHLFGGNYTTCSHFIGIGSILPTLRPKADCFFNHVFINQDKSFKYVTFLHLFLFSEYVLRVFGLSSTWLQTSVWKFLDMCGVSGYKSSLSVIYSKPYFILMQFVSFCPASNYGY